MLSVWNPNSVSSRSREFCLFYGIGIGLGIFFDIKKVSEPVSFFFGTEKSIGIGLEKNLVPKKVSELVSIFFGTEKVSEPFSKKFGTEKSRKQKNLVQKVMESVLNLVVSVLRLSCTLMNIIYLLQTKA